MTNNSIQVFAGGWKQLQHAKQVNTFAVPSADLPVSVTWKPDGTKFILLIADNPDFIQEFTVSTPWDTTGAVAGSTFSVNPPESNPRGMYWKLDGTRCFIVGTALDAIIQFNVSTPWDVSTMSDPGISVVLVGLNGSPAGITFSKDGLILYTTDAGDDLMDFNLTVPFDLSTLDAIAENTIDISEHSDLPEDIIIHPNGKFIYIISRTSMNVARYVLSVPFDITTLSFAEELDISNISNNNRGLFIRENDGKKLYLVIGGTDTLFTFDMSLATNNAIITNDGDELTTVLGEILVAA